MAIDSRRLENAELEVRRLKALLEPDREELMTQLRNAEWRAKNQERHLALAYKEKNEALAVLRDVDQESARIQQIGERLRKLPCRCATPHTNSFRPNEFHDPMCPLGALLREVLGPEECERQANCAWDECARLPYPERGSLRSGSALSILEETANAPQREYLWGWEEAVASRRRLR